MSKKKTNRAPTEAPEQSAEPESRQVPHTTFVCVVPETLINDPDFGRIRKKRGERIIVPTGGPMYDLLARHGNAFRIEGTPTKRKGAKRMKPPKMERTFTPQA